ncbi:hypothetical protein ACEWY4_027065 [Coilia grayii]|uniref:Insulin-like domain-containing protein n=1 Tax=Coilia grayii TaxID=363190 RepID=A0ABD1IRE3_9TELE
MTHLVPAAPVVLLLLLLLSSRFPECLSRPAQRYLCGFYLVEALYLHLVNTHTEVRKRRRRGIVEQCCSKPCSIHHLQNYRE